MTDIESSYRWCGRMARARARNFYYAFLALDRTRRGSLCAVYAFMRQCDDLSDEPGASRESLQAWRAALDDALAGRPAGHPLWPAFADTVRRYSIPHACLHDMIDGVLSDLDHHGFETFEELYRYGYQVASVAGLCVIHIFGFSNPQALLLAEHCGIAFQLTNILRDVKEDFERGRVYLPAADMARFGVKREDLGAAAESAGFLELMRFEAARARAYYAGSAPLLDMVDPACRPALWALIEIYSRLLGRIEAAGYRVLGRRVRVPRIEKAAILGRALVHRWIS